jgi:hypothetical protein
MAGTRAGVTGGVRLAARGGPRDVARLTARIQVLLEEAAHQGTLALRLMVQARELSALAVTGGDPSTVALIRDLERRLRVAERTGLGRVRRARLAIVPRPRRPPADAGRPAPA